MARLYSNENFPQPVVEELRRLGHDVLTSLDAGKANQSVPDDEVVRYAAAEGRAVLTLNRRHFHTQHRRSPEHAGIVTCTVDVDYAALAWRIHRAVDGKALAGQLIKVYRPD